jgi:MFS family permease
MRARYIGLYSLSFRVAAGIGPVLGGFLSDQIAPVATWYGGIGICLLACAGFFSLSKRWQRLVTPVEALPLTPAETTLP